MNAPPRGNLVRNGDFECGTVGTPPQDWISTNVSVVGQAATGSKSAGLGEPCPFAPAVIYQDVPVCPLRRYRLTFNHLSGGNQSGALVARVQWLDSKRREISEGLCVLIQSQVISCPCDLKWITQVHVTGSSPANACVARLIFSRSESLSGCDPTFIDTVTFADTV